MDIILIHGMARTRFSLLLLSHRLRRAGHRVHFLDYVPALESLERASGRLANLVARKIQPRPYAMITHSLGSVIARHALPRLAEHPPRAAYFLAPPMIACRAAKFFLRFRLYRMVTSEMGALLAQDEFMRNLPVPRKTRIYVGTSGPRLRWLPFGHEVNDGILLASEAIGDGTARVQLVRCSHTMIMNRRAVADDINASLAALA
jgi:alpha-beta hydrolase superfamily lysophospholipase